MKLHLGPPRSLRRSMRLEASWLPWLAVLQPALQCMVRGFPRFVQLCQHLQVTLVINYDVPTKKDFQTPAYETYLHTLSDLSKASICPHHASLTVGDAPHSSYLADIKTSAMQVTLVINYDVPTEKDFQTPAYETYLHRIGRSGRFGRKGAAFNFVTGQQVQPPWLLCLEPGHRRPLRHTCMACGCARRTFPGDKKQLAASRPGNCMPEVLGRQIQLRQQVQPRAAVPGFRLEEAAPTRLHGADVQG